MSVCENCKWNTAEQIEKGLWVYGCEELSDNYLSEDGCYHYTEVSDEDD